MQQQNNSDTDVKADIKAELTAIYALVTKIKEELQDINDYVQKDGTLDAAQNNAIQSLSSRAASVGITVAEPVHDEDVEPATNPLARVSIQYITEMLESLSHK